MPDEIKPVNRYAHIVNENGHSYMEKRGGGHWVKYEDYEALLKVSTSLKKSVKTINDIHKLHLVTLAKDTHIICGPDGMCLCGVYDGKPLSCGDILSLHSEDFRKALTFETILPGGKACI